MSLHPSYNVTALVLDWYIYSAPTTLPLAVALPDTTDPSAPPRSVRLTDICYKPFGDACAVQSVLQYWKMNGTLYGSEQAKPAGAPGRMTPEYCFSHWWVVVGLRVVGDYCSR